MRQRGKVPAVVFIDTDAGPNALPRWARWENVDPSLCDIDITVAESLARLDLRLLVGLTVHVSGTNATRVRTVAEAAKKHAKRVISSCLQQIGQDEFVAFKTLWVEDTEGILDGKRIAA
jgi:hypothetical protein